MSIYGDRGNIICLQKRCESRGIKAVIKNISLQSPLSDLEGSDLLFMGGAQDSQQIIASLDLLQEKRKVLTEMIESGIPGLYICGAYQLLGKYYEEASGTIIEGLGIFDLYTKNPGSNYKRLSGNISTKINQILFPDYGTMNYLVGFENHGGRTYLGKNIQPLGKTIKGFGNNDTEKTEGAVYKNSIGSYLHGPILPKNPQLADFLIEKALEKKYGKHPELEKLDDTLSYQAHNSMLKHI
jgi:hypothetical protein